MCIAIYKPKGFAMPSKKSLRNCFENNNDGAGFMYAFDDKVHILKGFETFSDFHKSLKSEMKKIDKTNGFNTDLVLHFRISTQGGVQQGLTHPYPICDDYDFMRSTECICDMGLAHNGIIDVSSNYYVKDHNDTMEFIKEILSPMINGRRNFYKSNALNSVVNYLLGKSNKIVILDGSGKATMYGDWIEDHGVYYSNESYKRNLYSWKKTDFSKFKLTKNSLSIEQHTDLMNTGYCYCEKCGDLLYLSYDAHKMGYVLKCFECGETYDITKEEEENCSDYWYDRDEDEYYSQLEYGIAK